LHGRFSWLCNPPIHMVTFSRARKSIEDAVRHSSASSPSSRIISFPRNADTATTPAERASPQYRSVRTPAFVHRRCVGVVRLGNVSLLFHHTAPAILVRRGICQLFLQSCPEHHTVHKCRTDMAFKLIRRYSCLTHLFLNILFDKVPQVQCWSPIWPQPLRRSCH
jgi:hypothetical protein